MLIQGGTVIDPGQGLHALRDVRLADGRVAELGDVYNLDGPVFDLATTMSKFLHLGLSLDEVVAMTTTAPAQALRGAAALGTLKPGAVADVTLLALGP